ncbi:MAG: FtsQ-type POTRA domain-containing protein [Anaerolineaceae bacterium]|jgi:cell division protein FtsQ
MKPFEKKPTLSRADQVRQRRLRESQKQGKPLAENTSRKVSPFTAPARPASASAANLPKVSPFTVPVKAAKANELPKVSPFTVQVKPQPANNVSRPSPFTVPVKPLAAKKPAQTSSTNTPRASLGHSANQAATSYAQPAYGQVRTRPVVIRNHSMGVPVQQRAHNGNRRRYYLNLNKEGAELQFPALPFIKPTWRWVSGSMSIAILALIVFLLLSPKFRVNAVNISGLQRLDPTDVTAALNLQNSTIFAIDTTKLKSILANSYPELADVTIGVSMPGTVNISARERIPLLAWKYNNQTQWIDADGYIFPARGSATPALGVEADCTPPLMMADGSPASTPGLDEVTPTPGKIEPATPPRLYPTVMASILKLNQRIPQQTTLAYSASEGLGWYDSNGWSVYIGLSLDNLDTQITMYNAIASKLEQQGIHPALVSLVDVDAPYYRLER